MLSRRAGLSAIAGLSCSAIISDAKFRWDSLTGALNTGEIVVDVGTFIELFPLFDSGVINNLDDGL